MVGGRAADETRAETVRRRLRTIPPLVLGLVLATALLPVLVVAAVVTGRRAADRLRSAGHGRAARSLRLWGLGALLDGAPDADVVVVAHQGLEGAA